MDMPFYLGVLFLTISLIAFAISLGGIIYQHMVEFPNWSAHMPESLDAYKSFFKTRDFGDFFKIFMPASGLGLLIAVFLLWNKPVEVKNICSWP